MTTAATISARLVLNAESFHEGLDQADKKANDFASKMGNVGKTMAGIGAGMTAGLTVPIVAGLSQAVDAASSLGESVNKMNVVFGDSAKGVEEWSKTSAAAMGISQQAAVEAAATYGNLFTALGMGREPAAEMSTSLVQLASDLASFNNANPEDVLNALRSGLSGEVEPLKRFGIAMNEATMKAKALQMGLGQGAVDMEKVNRLTLDMEAAQLKYNAALEKYGEGSLEARQAAQKMAEIQSRLEDAMKGGNVQLTEAEKLQVRYALIMDQTSNAQGDFARTSDGLANSMRITKAQFADTAAQLGQQLLPYVMKGMLLIQQLINWFTTLTGSQQKWALVIAVVVAAIGPLLTIVGTLITIVSSIGPAIAGAGAAMAPFLLPILAIIGVIALLYLAWTNNWGGIQEKAAAVWAWLQPILMELWNWLQTNIPLALQALSNFWQTVLLPAIMAVWTWITTVLFPALGELWNWISPILGAALQALADFWQTILLPAIMAVWTWITTVLFPFFGELFNFIGNIFTAVLGALADAWTNVLQPAIAAVWEWMSGTVFPFWQAVANFFSAVFGLVIRVLAGLWQNVLAPAIASVFEWLSGKLYPIFKTIGDFISGTLVPVFEAFGSFLSGIFMPIIKQVGDWIYEHVLSAFDSLGTSIRSLTEWLNNIANQLNNLQLPDWLTPGSPTPLELGLVGINKAMGRLASSTLPTFNAGLELSPVGVDGGENFAAASMAGTPQQGRNDNSQIVYWLQQIAGKKMVTAEEITKATRDADLKVTR